MEIVPDLQERLHDLKEYNNWTTTSPIPVFADYDITPNFPFHISDTGEEFDPENNGLWADDPFYEKYLEQLSSISIPDLLQVISEIYDNNNQNTSKFGQIQSIIYLLLQPILQGVEPIDCLPSVEYIAELAEVSTSSVSRALRQLKKVDPNIATILNVRSQLLIDRSNHERGLITSEIIENVQKIIGFQLSEFEETGDPNSVSTNPELLEMLGISQSTLNKIFHTIIAQDTTFQQIQEQRRKILQDRGRNRGLEIPEGLPSIEEFVEQEYSAYLEGSSQTFSTVNMIANYYNCSPHTVLKYMKSVDPEILKIRSDILRRNTGYIVIQGEPFGSTWEALMVYSLRGLTDYDVKSQYPISGSNARLDAVIELDDRLIVFEMHPVNPKQLRHYRTLARYILHTEERINPNSKQIKNLALQLQSDFFEQYNNAETPEEKQQIANTMRETILEAYISNRKRLLEENGYDNFDLHVISTIEDMFRVIYNLLGKNIEDLDFNFINLIKIFKSAARQLLSGFSITDPNILVQLTGSTDPILLN